MGKQKVISESELKPRLPEKDETLGVVEKLLGDDRVIASFILFFQD